ncbi:hypothetical protein AURDEDRAFT_167233 [Auricularia subglabra TFB-10046 SS5]|nr:hypothetical protein AURDEDRAFT_167233 [Auricularia subglabra TFB-10046 SS5]
MEPKATRGNSLPVPNFPSIVHVSRSAAAAVYGNPLFGPSASNGELMTMMRMLGLLRYLSSPTREVLHKPLAKGFSRNNIHEKTVKAVSHATDPLSPLHSYGTMILRFIDPIHQVHSRTPIFYPALTGDMLVLLELLRWGARLDDKDVYGYTPLLACLVFIRVSLLVASRPYSSDGSSRTLQTTLFGDQIPGRLKEAAKVMINHHAAVNVSVDGATPLGVACEMADWELIELLLAHGAILEPYAAERLFPDSESATRFAGLRSKYFWTERPPRLCPCASGRALPDCHAAPGPHAYPSELYCPCAATGESYGSCCLGKTEWTEYWDAENKVLVARKGAALVPDTGLRVPPAPQLAGWQFTIMDTLRKDAKSANPFPRSKRLETVCWAVMGLMDEHDFGLEPGFAKVFSSVWALPRVARRTDLYSKVAYTYPSMWNYAVDDYHLEAARYGDNRSPREIDVALKVDWEGTPLYKRCGHCEKVEGEPAVHKRCSICKQAFYCNERSHSFELFQATIKETDRLGMMDWVLTASLD